MKKTPPKNRANVRVTKPAADADTEALAISGVGARWRLLAASVNHIACPACLAPAATRCDGPRRQTCPSRLYALAAILRRTRNPLAPDTAAETLRALRSDNPGEDTLRAALTTAIDHGLVRLHVGPDGQARWVDAVTC